MLEAIKNSNHNVSHDRANAMDENENENQDNASNRIIGDTDSDDDCTPVFTFQPKHFINSSLHIESTSDKSKQFDNVNDSVEYDGTVDENEFARQLGMQNCDKNRQRQAKYYNRDKNDDPWKNAIKLKFKIGTKNLPRGDYCLQNLGLVKEFYYKLGDINGVAVVVIDAHYIVPAEKSYEILEVSSGDISSILNESATYKEYTIGAIRYLDQLYFDIDDDI